MRDHLQRFMQKEASAGIVLMFVTVLALFCSNSFLSPWYQSFLHLHVGVYLGSLSLDKSLYHWVNDGLMAVFFFLIGLEVKREMLEGQLSSLRQVTLPAIAAIGGMLVPALVYVFFTAADAVAVKGWAIPCATDIAFALGVLSLLGSRVPASLKIFLMALAIVDDLGAVVIIALFYTQDLSILSIVIASVCLVVLIGMNVFGVINKTAYILVGLALWLSVMQSGVHATLAGIALAFTVPMRVNHQDKQSYSLLKEFEHGLHAWVAFLILPVFAFVNAGVNVQNISLAQMTMGVPMGIALGLFVGKQLGVFGFSFLAIKSGMASLPEGSRWGQLYGVSVLTGIGFTMSLFITSLAFESDALFQFTDKLAVLIGSFVSAVIGCLILWYASKKNNQAYSLMSTQSRNFRFCPR